IFRAVFAPWPRRVRAHFERPASMITTRPASGTSRYELSSLHCVNNECNGGTMRAHAAPDHTGPDHTGRHRPIWRRTGWVLGACTVLAAAAVGAGSDPGAASVSGPPPGPGAVSSAAGQVRSRAAQLNEARVQLAVASARLAALRNQAEVIIERYDKT